MKAYRWLKADSRALMDALLLKAFNVPTPPAIHAAIKAERQRYQEKSWLVRDSEKAKASGGAE